FILPEGDCATRRMSLLSVSSMIFIRKPSSVFRDHAQAHVQAAETAVLFGLLQGDVGKVFGAPKGPRRDIGGGGFIVNARLSRASAAPASFLRASRNIKSAAPSPILPLPSGCDSASVRASQTAPQWALFTLPKGQDSTRWVTLQRISFH